MLKTKNLVLTVILASLFISNIFAETLEENWNDFLHYTKIGRLDLAKGYAQAVLDSNPDPVELLTLSQQNRDGYAILLQVKDTTNDDVLADPATKVYKVIERGRFVKRTDPLIIIEEVRRINTTERGRMTAVRRLQDAGEYSIMYLLDAMQEGFQLIGVIDHIDHDELVGTDAAGDPPRGQHVEKDGPVGELRQVVLDQVIDGIVVRVRQFQVGGVGPVLD